MRLALAVLVLALVAPASASAHAVLTGTVPERGAALKSTPEAIVLKFNEPVEAAFGAIKVYDAQGKIVPVGEPFRPSGTPREIAVKPSGELQGGYTVTYRVVSADSHPISSGFVFAVGEGAAPSATVDELLAGSEAGPVSWNALAAARGIQYAAIALGLGTALFLLACWLPALRETAGASSEWEAASAAFAGRARTLLALAAVAGTLSAACAVVLQGAVASATSFWSALSMDTVGDVLGTRFGTVWGVGALAWVAVLALVALRLPRLPVMRPASVGAAGLALPSPGPAALAPLAPLALLAAVPALGGHAGVTDPRWVLLPANIAHVAGMAAWLGGIAVLVVALRSATQALGPEDRTRLLAVTVSRFSALAGAAVALILATGIIQSIVHLESFADFVDTAFGRAILVKIVLFAGIVGLGFVNRNRLLPRLRAAAADGTNPGATGRSLRRVLRIELGLGLAVLVATAALAGYAPPASLAAGPFSTDFTLGPARAEVTVDPARVGANEMHLYLFDRRSGAQYDGTEELTVRLSLPEKKIAPIEVEARKAGPGHFVMSGATFGVAGEWTVEMTARVSDFDAYDNEFKLPIE